jgi:hypothetical protein
MPINSLVSFIFTCVAAAAFVLTTAASGQALELCAKADKSDPTQPKEKSKISLRSACKPGKEVSVGTTDDLAAIASKADQSAVDALEANSLSCASQLGNDVFFDGCNVHVRSGAGTTSAAINGLGNLIVGYDEDDGADDKSGSHNLVVGPNHSYSRYGGFAAGYNNNVSGNYSSVSGGGYNTASGTWSSVSGGQLNAAEGSSSWVSGGANNIASESYSSVSGGWENTASGEASSVSGGYQNSASGPRSSVTGGRENTASGRDSSVSGGYGNIASAHRSSVSGGLNRTAADSDDWAAGALFEDE